jgi:crossover junction endodeoxyribonuclease RuvC
LKELILGLDPGSRITGFGVLEACGDEVKHIAHGVIRLNESQPLSERLCALHRELRELFARFAPTTVVVESIFFGKNADSAFKLGHARGVCLLAAAQAGAGIEEYAARYVKKAMTGSGAASKEQVQLMVFNWLRIQPEESAFDATDALSLAVTHARESAAIRLKKRFLEGAP